MLESEQLMANLACIFNCMLDVSFSELCYPFGLEAQTKKGIVILM